MALTAEATGARDGDGTLGTRFTPSFEKETRSTKQKADNYHDLKVVAGNDHFSVLDPLHRRNGLAGHGALKLNVHPLVGVKV